MMRHLGLELRLLGPDDAPQIAALEAKIFADAWDAGHFAGLLGQDRFLAAGAFDGRDLLAYLTAYSLDGELEIVNVAVDSPFRGRGIGKELMHYFLKEGRLHGAVRAVLEVRSGNAAALGLYASCGFTQVGLRKRYYADSGEDALILEWTPCLAS